MSGDSALILRRIDQLLGAHETAQGFSYAVAIEHFQSTLALVTTLYGSGSHQTQTLLNASRVAEGYVGELSDTFPQVVPPVIVGTLRAMRADVESGLVGRIQQRAAGEVLGDMLGLAKEAISRGSESTKNVAAVLAAAAYEDTIRQMGTTLANVTGRPDLADVITALKKAGVLVGAAQTIGQGYLKFRNDALHADWEKLDRAVVASCIAYVEGLLLTHFS